MLRIRRTFSIFCYCTRLGVFGVAGLSLLTTMAADGVAQNGGVQHRLFSRHATPARLTAGYVVDGGSATNFQQFGFHQAQWRRWPSFSPHATETSPAGQGSPLTTPIVDLPEPAREDKPLPPKRDTPDETSTDPVDPPNPKNPLGNPFENDKADIDRIPGLPDEKPLPADGGATSSGLPRNIVSQVPQTSVIPGRRLAAPVQITAQTTALSSTRPLDDSAPRPADVELERSHPKLLSPLGPVPVEIAVPVKIAPPEVRQPKTAEPISVQGEVPRKPASGPYNPLRLRWTIGPTSTLVPTVRRSSHQQPVPRRRNPLR